VSNIDRVRSLVIRLFSITGLRQVIILIAKRAAFS
jgi:hypothetical protein